MTAQHQSASAAREAQHIHAPQPAAALTSTSTPPPDHHSAPARSLSMASFTAKAFTARPTVARPVRSSRVSGARCIARHGCATVCWCAWGPPWRARGPANLQCTTAAGAKCHSVATSRMHSRWQCSDGMTGGLHIAMVLLHRPIRRHSTGVTRTPAGQVDLLLSGASCSIPEASST